MARQKGIIPLIGTIGDLNFYFSKGKGYARQAGGGFNGEVIKTKDSMLRVRENATEFGAASTALKAFRRSLRPIFNPPKYKELHERLMRLFTQLKDLDLVSERGGRRVAKGIATAKGKYLLEHFVFLPNKVLEYVVSHAQFDWSEQKLSFSSMDLSAVPLIKGSTHVALNLIVIDFDFEQITYTFQTSGTVLLDRGAIEAFTMQPNSVIAPQHTGIVALGLQFCEVFGGEVYPMKGISGLDCRIIEVGYGI